MWPFGEDLEEVCQGLPSSVVEHKDKFYTQNMIR